MFPTRSFARTAAPCKPVYVHLDRFGYAIYRRATATAWILLEAVGTFRLTVSLSSSDKIEGILTLQTQHRPKGELASVGLDLYDTVYRDVAEIREGRL